jgi:hypothetical protein
VSTRPEFRNGRLLGLEAQTKAIHSTIDCIDCLLLSAERLQLEKYGLEAITNAECCAALDQLLSHPEKAIALYQWPTRVATFLREQIATLPNSDCERAMSECPLIGADIPDPDDRFTNLDADEIVRARAWLWREGYYTKALRSVDGFFYVPSMTRFIPRLYRNVIGAGRSMPQIPELGLGPGVRACTEYPRARVTAEVAPGTGKKALQQYSEAFRRLGQLREAGIKVANLSGDELDAHVASLAVRQEGRFRTLPARVVFSLLKHAIHFFLANGSHIVESFLAVAAAAKLKGTSISKFAMTWGIEDLLTPASKRFGIQEWTIESCFAGSGVMRNPPKVLSPQEYYSRFRANVGLYELLIVLYGSAQFILGVVSARRQGELIDLECGAVLDKSRTRLVFKNRKSGPMGLRTSTARPIPPIAVRVVETIERIRTELSQLGIAEPVGRLFAIPNQRGKKAFGTGEPDAFNIALDSFCDYFEAPLDSHGRRYYVRQHQLRRFFAMMFFWAAGFGGLDTLRYMLAHTTPKYVWRYITETVPGPILRGAKAGYAVQSVHAETPESRALADLLEQEFGTRQFQLVDEDVLNDYVEVLIERGDVKVEPKFLDHGRTYRIAIVVSPIGASK